MKISISIAVIMRNVAIGLVLLSLVGQCYGDEASFLQKGYYNGKCIKRGRGFFGFIRREVVDVERTVTDIIRRRFAADKTIAPALLRMQFHDCFVKGCDASILLDGGNNTEKSARANQSVREFDLIDDIKAELESLCPQVVSCADIIVMATRDSVYFASSEYPKSRYPPKSFDVQTGRKDGFESLASNVDLPRPTASIPDSLAAFAQKGLNAEDLTYLLGGGHSVGVTHCGVIQDRLFNVSNTDIAMNDNLRKGLIEYCDNPNKTINLDQGTPDTVDASLYQQVKIYRRGILRADQELASNEQTSPIVDAILKGSYRGSSRNFNANFWQAMVKLQAVGVKRFRGEVRRNCRATNGIL